MTPADVQLLQESDLFDSDWYTTAHPEVRDLAITPHEHYLRIGAMLGYDPGPAFSTTGYLLDAPDVDAAGVNPLAHYLRLGRSEGRSVRRAGEELASAPPPADTGAVPGRHDPVTHPGRRNRQHDRRLVLVVGHLAGAELFGAERSLLDLLDAFAINDVDTVVAVPSDQNRDYLDALTDRSTAVHVMPVPARRPRQPADTDLIEAYVDLISRTGVDAVHVNTILPREPLLAARRSGVPAVVHARERPVGDPDLERWFDAPAEEIVASVLEEAEYVIATSRAVADTFALAGRTAVVPNVVDEALFDLPNEDHDVVRVALVGSVQPKKGIAEFVEVARLLQPHTTARFEVVGPISPFVYQIADIGLPPNVEFAGPAADPIAAMGDADIVVNMSTVAEGFGRTALEAMAAGRPVVVNDLGALPEVVQDGVCGFVVPNDDVTLFAHRVHQLIDDPDLRRTMGAAGRVLARAEYTRDRAAAKLATAYRAILPGAAVLRQQATDVRIPIPRNNRSQFPDQFFIANRARFATATSVAFLDRHRLVVASLIGKRMHVIRFDPEAGAGEVVGSAPTTDGVEEITVDLMAHDGEGRLIAANCEHASITRYSVSDGAIEFIDTTALDAATSGYCHGVSFLPGRPALAAVATITGPCQLALVALGDGRRIATFSDDGWVTKSVDVDDRGRAIVCLMNEPVGRGTRARHDAKLVLLQFDEDFVGVSVLDEAVLLGETLDGCCLCGDLVLGACQSQDALVAFAVSGDRLSRLPDLLGFSFPHDVDVSPDREWIAVANYGTSDVQLRPMPPELSALASARTA
jgi:glycosyltransferase involved in cell wall biosynthesis